ncbi:MAG: type II toxin-antitoxin system Phd/YefM family antitoxin [Ilumatobacteraceae bacterium]
MPHRVRLGDRRAEAARSFRDRSAGAVHLSSNPMTRIMVMSETLPLAEVKAKLSEMVDRVEHTRDRITVTRNGRPAAVLISPDELASLEDTLELLSDPAAMEQLRAAEAAVADGDFATGDELRARYGTR